MGPVCRSAYTGTGLPDTTGRPPHPHTTGADAPYRMPARARSSLVLVPNLEESSQQTVDSDVAHVAEARPSAESVITMKCI